MNMSEATTQLLCRLAFNLHNFGLSRDWAEACSRPKLHSNKAELSCLTWTCITSLVPQQFTPQLITAHVQVIASMLPPHASATHFKERCISLQLWREANVYTVTQSPTHPHHRRRRQQHLKGCGRLRAQIRSSEVHITIRSKRMPKRSKQLSRSQIHRNLAVDLSTQ